MSTFVEIDPSEYDKNAFADFDASTGDFRIGNARALMWLSQLAYEAHRKETIDEVALTKWGFTFVGPFVRPKTSVEDSYETCGIIGERAGAVILAFAGTDPGVWQNLATDAAVLPRTNSDIHDGFLMAAEAVSGDIDDAVERAHKSQKPLFIGGHSLGAALAALAAVRTAANGSPPRAVYGFGMPRVGGEQFRTDYGDLGKVTYRLVHGIDLVARVPPSVTGFRHVGRVLQCKAGAKFVDTPPVDSDEPLFSRQLSGSVRRLFSNLLAGRIFSPVGPGTFAPVFRFIPPEIRDHLQDSYWKALTP
jgi:triacylglycerol lipase